MSRDDGKDQEKDLEWLGELTVSKRNEKIRNRLIEVFREKGVCFEHLQKEIMDVLHNQRRDITMKALRERCYIDENILNRHDVITDMIDALWPRPQAMANAFAPNAQQELTQGVEALSLKAREKWLTEDGPWLLRSLKALDLRPAKCRSRIVCRSGSTVYAITPACDKIVMAYRNEQYAIKVVHNQEEFTREGEALMKIAPDWFKGTVYCGDGGISKFLPNPKPPLAETQAAPLPPRPKSNSERPGVWVDFPDLDTLEPSAGGCIVMKCGLYDLFGHLTSLKKRSQRIEVIDNAVQDVMGCLRLAHANSVLHTDIRPTNIVKFKKGGKWRLIDYGLCATLPDGAETAPVEVKTGAQADNAGPRVKQQLEDGGLGKGSSSVEVQWRKSDDYEMLTQMTSHLYRVEFDSLRE